MAWYFGALCEEVIERPRFDQTRLYPDLVQKTSTIDRFEIVSKWARQQGCKWRRWGG